VGRLVRCLLSHSELTLRCCAMNSSCCPWLLRSVRNATSLLFRKPQTLQHSRGLRLEVPTSFAQFRYEVEVMVPESDEGEGEVSTD
jgi:hypothetical protein